ncbi:MAG TPA: lysine--tRNA ligase [Ktedonobacterales bacterium]|nr:lysine--tRNA ligase [Ktedonobacterales bacterium]
MEEREVRLEKLHTWREEGISPYPTRAERTHTTQEALEQFEELQAAEQEITLVGRVMLVRDMGKTTFMHIEDGAGRIQIYFRRDDVGEEVYPRVRRLDIGDIIQASGHLFATRTGERTLKVHRFRLLSKALQPLPAKYHGLQDVDLRYRKRYLDLIANRDEVLPIFVARSKAITAMRRYLDNHGYLEVETPTLQPVYGGATARPFITHHNALDRDFYLRIADELYLKRLIVGGIERVYEICKDFRNEGIDRTHQPEFTMMECYQAYGDYEQMMRLVEEMTAEIAIAAKGSTRIVFQGTEVNVEPPWPRLKLREAIAEFTGIEVERYPDRDELAAVMRERGYEADEKLGRGRLIDDLKSQMMKRGIAPLKQALFLTDYPLDVSPLAKQREDDPTTVERFQPFYGGLEGGNAYTELNDPLEQRARFEDQARQRARGDDEAQVLDEDFLEALEHGMPPTGGLGIGIDRLVMFLTDQETIRDVMLFPTLRD